jgi:hypothetical protein
MLTQHQHHSGVDAIPDSADSQEQVMRAMTLHVGALFCRTQLRNYVAIGRTPVERHIVMVLLGDTAVVGSE